MTEIYRDWRDYLIASDEVKQAIEDVIHFLDDKADPAIVEFRAESFTLEKYHDEWVFLPKWIDDDIFTDLSLIREYVLESKAGRADD